MNIARFISDWWKEALEYKERVLKDGGTTKREDVVQQYNQMCKQNGIFDSIKFAWLGEAGGKLRTSGVNQFWTKAYSLVTTNDATQTTSTSQPYLAGNIAPTERLGMKNPNGASNYMTHPTISFAANEAWSLSLNFMPFGSNTGTTSRIYGNDTASKTRIELAPNGGTLYVYGETANASIAIPNRKGKNTNLNLLYDGAGNVDVIIEKTLIGTIVVNSAFTFNTIGCASGGQYFYGIINAVALRSGKLTPFQYNPESNFFSTRYNQIPNVTIGSQVWATSNCDMVATPQGNLIANVTENANVEKITNVADRDFSSDTGFWNKIGSSVIGSGVCRIYSPTGTISGIDRNILSLGKYYKFTYTVISNLGGSLQMDGIGNGSFLINSTPGTYSYILKCTETTFRIKRTTGITDITIDNVSIQEIGWANSTELYDAIYAQTSGTDEQKTYAGVKAAAMWCYYNNNDALGSIYNKLYNDYAMKLLAMDIAYYNTANPSTPWGWDIPLESDWTTLQTTVNNNAEALKHAGTTYWSAPNAGTNSSGFTALPAGYRKEDGTFAGLNTTALFGSTDMSVPIIGKSLRLIKR